jgi:flagellar export protein FliJ
VKKFRFRLERVLHYRETVKGERRRELLEANYALQTAEAHLAELESAQRALGFHEGAVMSVAEIQIQGLYGARLKAEIAAQHDVIKTAENAVFEARTRYVEASKDCKSLEVLKEKRRAEYAEYVLKEDEKFLDEFTIQKGSPERQKESGQSPGTGAGPSKGDRI